ncbi:MAG: BRCT domain-containing protein [Planctomycetota bacterium]
MKQNWDLIVLLSFLVVFVIASMFAGWKMYELNTELQQPQNTTDPYGAYNDPNLVQKQDKMVIDAWLIKEQRNVSTMQEQVDTLRSERANLIESIAKYQLRDEGYKERGKDAKQLGDDYLDAIGAIKKLTADGAKLNTDLQASTDKAKSSIEHLIEAEKDDNSKRMDELNNELHTWDAREAAHLADFDRRSRQHAENFRNLSRTLQADESRLSVLTKQSQKEVDLKPDGKVIFSNPDSRIVNIDRGLNDKVVPGMRFEVYTEREGFRRVRKGFIEVERVYQTYSQCLAIKTPIELPTDPLSEYVAPQPEYQFSPYTSRGGAASPLTGVPVSQVWTPDSFEPIVAGDLINNPFYNPRRQLTFYFVGSTPIYYTKKDITKIIELHGGRVVDKMSPEVDYVIAQAFQGPPTQLNDAVQQGANILYEWQLFPFLRPR